MNRFSKQRKIISQHKLHRIYNANLDKTGVAMIYKNHNQSWQSSLMAVRSGDFVYAVFPTTKQSGSKLSTYCIKYNVVDSPLDNIVFKPFPSKIIQNNVEF